jgi:hypothetical protein
VSTASTSSGSSTPLAFTGADIGRDLGVGLLCIGLGLMMLGWSVRGRVRRQVL